MKGGIPMDCMRDFVVDENLSYSFDYLKSYNYSEMIKSNKPKIKGYCPTKEVMEFIKDEIFTH